MSDKLNDKLIQVISRLDINNARLAEIVHCLEGLFSYIEDRDKKLDKEYYLQSDKHGGLNGLL